MTNYEQTMLRELQAWQRKMMRKPGILNRLSKRAQDKLNSIIPEKVHNAITIAIKQMVRGVL
ncbi:MAG TPA: EcsC family protein, partial [Niastella sp.]|nr:EcsC family protein [Niastella sp.]